MRMSWSATITAVRSAGIAWIKPGSVFGAIDAPSEGVMDALLVARRRSEMSPETPILLSDAIPLQLPIRRCRVGDGRVSARLGRDRDGSSVLLEQPVRRGQLL